MTYADIDRISDEVAVGLAQRGVGEGDVVALVLPPGPEYLLAYCAAAKLGAITAGVNDRLSARERDAVLDLADPKLVIAVPAAASLDGVLTDYRAPGTPPALADDPDRPGRDHLHVRHHRAAEGRAVQQPPARVHHPDRRRRHVGRWRPFVHAARRSRTSAS